MKKFKYWVEDAPTNATGTAVVGTGDDDSTVVVRKKPKVYKRKKRMTDKEIEEARNYRSEYDNYHSKPEQRERNAARLRARRFMIKNGKAARGDGKDVHHKDNDPLNNEDDNLKVTDRSWNRREPRLREAVDKDAARELEIYIENDQKLYKQKLIPIVKNIQKKIASGKYDHKKAPKLWMYLVDEAAKKYIKDHGSRGEKIDSIFNKETRMAVAQNLADNYRDEIDAQGGTMFESLDEIAEAKYDIYHKTYSAAVQHAAAQAKKRGYEVDQDSWDSQITHGERKPSTGKTVSKKVALTKNGKPQRKKLQIQVHAMSSGKYELNMYIEEVEEIAEAFYYKMPNGKKLDITKLSLSNRRKLFGPKGLFKVVDGVLVPRQNTKAWRKKAIDDFAKYVGQTYPDVGEKEIDEVKESINIQERKLTDTELKRREEIAQDLSDADFKKRYGDRWKEVKMGVATNMAKKESMDEADDPGADSAKSKELKVAKAIAAAQLKIAKEQERIQKLTVMQQKAKESQSEETIMSKKYLNTKEGTLEEAVLNVWQDAAEEVNKLNQEGMKLRHDFKFPTSGVADRGKFPQQLVRKAIEIAKKHQDQMTIATKKIEKLKRGLSDDPEVKAALQHYNEQKEDAASKVDGRTKQYKETLRRIKLRQERMRAKTKSSVTEENLEKAQEEIDKLKEAVTVYLDAHDPAWMKKAMKKYGVKGKIHKKNVNPGYDSWKVTGDPKKLYKLYTDDEYGGDESFDDFIDMHKESIHELYSVEFTFKSDRDAKSAVAFVEKHASPGKLETDISGKVVEFYRVGSDDKELKSVKAEVEQKFKGKIADTKIQNEETIRTEGSKEEYQKFFNAALKKFGAKSPAEMDDEKKKKFFNYIDKNWTKEEQQEFTEGKLMEKIEYVEYKFKNKAQAKAAAKFFDGQQLIDLDVNDDGASEGLLSVDAGKNDMTKVHNAIMKKMKPKVITTENERKN